VSTFLGIVLSFYYCHYCSACAAGSERSRLETNNPNPEPEGSGKEHRETELLTRLLGDLI